MNIRDMLVGDNFLIKYKIIIVICDSLYKEDSPKDQKMSSLSI